MPPHLIEDCFHEIGAVGRRLSEIRACEGAAGNISVYRAGPVELPPEWDRQEPFALPEPAPELAGGILVATGSGRPLREIADDPAASLGLVAIAPDGIGATLHTSDRRRFDRLTVELNSHLAVHRDQVARGSLSQHAVIHAQPFHLTLLGHLPAYEDERELSRAVLHWQPESIYHLPDGIAAVPFLIPASRELADATVAAARRSRLVLWRKHGVLARTERSLHHALELIEYAEVGARFAVANALLGGAAPGLTDAEVRAICAAFAVEQGVF